MHLKCVSICRDLSQEKQRVLCFSHHFRRGRPLRASVKLKYRLLGGEGGEGAFFIFRLTSRLWEAEGAGLVYTIIDQRGKEQGVLSPL